MSKFGPQAPAPTARRPSTLVPVIRRSEAEAISRPKHEIHPPPPKDLPYADAPKIHHRKTKRIKDDRTIEQLKYCGKNCIESNTTILLILSVSLGMLYTPISLLMLRVSLGQDEDSYLPPRSSRNQWTCLLFVENLTTKSILQLRSLTLTQS
ncbi:hypothetical protein BYT27DRAFT_6373249 [Phlegmacium glaucopus]|nr:hypothetical protein BYT27DRAFT_6373249 [Phlegmacium glaucopus]